MRICHAQRWRLTAVFMNVAYMFSFYNQRFTVYDLFFLCNDGIMLSFHRGEGSETGLIPGW